MTRLRRMIAAPRRLDLAEAFRVLGPGPSCHDLAVVVDLLRRSGVEAIDYDDELVAIAESHGSSAFVALDLAAAVAFGVESLTAGPPR